MISIWNVLTSPVWQQIKGFYYRLPPFRNSNSIEMCGPLLADLFFNSSGVLMPKSDYPIRMYSQPHSFCLMSAEAGAGYKLKVTRAELLVKKLIPHHMSIVQQSPVTFVQNYVRVVTLPTTTSTIDQQIFEGLLPRRIIVVQVHQDAFNGSYAMNPLNFQHFNVQRISVNMNEKSYPIESNGMNIDFARKNFLMPYIMNFIQLYDSEFEDLDGIKLTMDSYKRGYFMYPIALDAGGDAPNHGILRLKIDSGKPLHFPVVVLVFAEYARLLGIDDDGKIEIV